MGLIGKWIDLAVLVFAALGLLKGFKKGFVRELFSLVGAALAIVVALYGYQNLSQILIEKYPISEWQAQALAFGALVLGISLLGVLIGYAWSKVLSYTPFAVLDRLGGAAFGVVKVGAVVVLLLIVFNLINLSFVNAVLEESLVAEHLGVLVPFVYDYLELYWPDDWSRPAWLFPQTDPAQPAGFSAAVPLFLAGRPYFA